MLRGNDRLKTIVGAGGLSSPAVNLSHTLFRPENPVFCTVNARMNRHFMQLTGSPVHRRRTDTEESGMSRFRFREIRLENYRCFDALTLPLEEDTTVLFAENGGGKTALLTALAMGLAVVQAGCARNPEARRTARPQDTHPRREGATETGRSMQGHVDRLRRRIGIRHVVDGGSARVRTRQESTPGALRRPGAGTDARRAVAAVRVVRRRSPGPPPRPAPQGRADGGPLGSLRLRARPEPRRGPAAAVAARLKAQGRDGRKTWSGGSTTNRSASSTRP